MPTFTNNTVVSWPEAGTFTTSLSVNVSGLIGPLGTISVTLNGINQTSLRDLDFLLVAPDGRSYVFFSDIGSGSTGTVANLNLEISDSGAVVLPQSGAISTGTFRPANYPDSFGVEPTETAASFGATVTSISHATGTGVATFASVFSGYATPNGTWTLYIRDDADGDAGSLSGFSLNITSGSVSVIGDKVFEDLDGDGIQDAGEQGVDGVTVELLTEGGTVAQTTTTSNGGLYTFTNVADGNYSVKFTPASGTYYAFTSQNQGANDNLDSDVNASGQTGLFSVSGSNITHIDAGLRGTHIISQVFGDVDRDGIQDANETGIDGVTVRLLNSSGVSVATAVTGNGGKYDFANVAPGTYSLEYVTATGFAFSPKDVGSDALDSDANAGTGRTGQFSIALGQTVTDVDAGMYATANFGTYTFTNNSGINFPVAGTTTNVQTLTLGGISGPIAEVKVHINGLSHSHGDDLDFWLVGPDGVRNLLILSDVGGNGPSGPVNLVIADGGASALPNTTLASGTFRPTDINEEGPETAATFGVTGPTLVRAAPEGTATLASAFTGFSPNGTWTLYARDDAGGDGGSFTSWGLEVTTASVSVIGDKVFEDLDGDGVQDVGEPGVDGVTVQLLDTGNSVVQTTTTGGGGLYTFAGVMDGTYSLKFIAPVGGNYSFTAQNQGDDNLDSDVDASGQTASFAVAGSNITNIDAGLSGTHVGNLVFGDLDRDGVQDVGESGLDGVTVRLLDSTASVVATTETANGGIYDFANVTPGTYSIEVALPSQFSFSPKDDASATDATDSDVDTTTGRSGQFNIALGETINHVDAGVYATNGVGTFTFTNDNGVAFPTATPAVIAQTFSVGGVDGVISDIKVRLNGLSHNSPDDLDFLLVGPDGTSNLLFLSDAGGNAPGGPFNLVFTDSGGAGLPDSTTLSSGTFRPTDHTTGAEGLETGASFGISGLTVNHAAGAGSATLLSEFEGHSPNGTWTLYLRDDAPGDGGSLANWSLEITTEILNTPPTVPVDVDGVLGGTVTEGAASGTVVGITASSTDVEAPGSILYSLTNDAGGRFVIDATSGIVSVAAGANIDFESSAGSYTITVRAEDDLGAGSTADFAVSVTNVPPSTPLDADGGANIVAEGAAAGSGVGITVAASDVNGPGVTFSILADSSAGGFTIDPTSGVVSVADPTKLNYEAANSHSVTIQASDGKGGLSQSDFTIAVTNVAPGVPVDLDAQANGITEGAPAGTAVGITASAIDPSGGTLTYAISGDSSGGGFAIDPTTGVVTVVDSSKINYESASSHTLKVTASDGNITSGEGIFTIAVGNAAPVTAPDSYTAGEDQMLSIVASSGVLSNDQDPAGGLISAVIATGPANGSVILNADGSFTYTPNANFSGSDSFQYRASDGFLSSSDTTVSITVTAANDAPVISGLGPTVSAAEQTAVVLDGNVDVSDAELDALAGGAGNYAGAVLTIARSGGASAEDQFALPDGTDVHASGGAISDDNGRAYATYSTSGGTLTVIFTSDQRPATSALVDAVLRGVTYTNTSDAPPASVTLDYTFNDGNSGAQGNGGALTGSGSITVTINAVNDAPVAVDDVASGSEDTLITGSVATNDSDPEGDTLSFALNGAAPAGLTFNNDGSWSLDASDAAYQALGVGDSTDVVGSYTVSDGNGGSDTATLTITVNGVNDAPVANDDTASGSEDTLISGSVAMNDSDPEGDTLGFALSGAASAGLTFNNDGSWSLDASDAAYQALGVGDSIDVAVSYTVSDGNGGSDTATLTITVNGVNDAPVAADDAAFGSEDTLITGSVATNDGDPDGDPLSFVLNGAAPAGLTFNADGSWSLDASDAAYQMLSAGDSIDVVASYSVSDGNGGSDAATLTITVNAANDAPVGTPSAVLPDGFEDVPYIVSAVDLLDGFSDPEGDPLSVQNLAVVGGGAVADNGDGTYTITLPPDRAGSVTLTYQVSDGQGGLTPAVQGFEVIGDGDEAVFTGDRAGAVVEAGLAGPGVPTATGKLGVSDVDGPDTLVPILAGSRSIWGYGSVEMTKDGAWTYTLDNSHPTVDALQAGETLSDRFVAVAADGTQQVVLITISGAEDGVRAVPGTPGDDTLVSTAADETIAGGRGFDMAVFSGAASGYEFTRLGDGSVKIVDIDPSDGDNGTDTLSSIEMLRFGTAAPVTLGSLAGQPEWTLDKADIALTAAAYQFFTGAVPSAAGFEYLILSPANPNDLNDPYYAGFNLENLYLNFASNLGTAGAGAALFDAEYGALDFEATVKAAYLDIVGTELTGAALDFFLDAESFYQSVAAERVVRPGVDLAEATKIVAIGSILNEAVRADSGLLGQAVNDFAAIVNASGTAEDFGMTLLV